MVNSDTDNNIKNKSNMSNIKLKKEFNDNFKELRKIINSWNFTPDSPQDEFDSLNHQILSLLYKDSSQNKIYKFLNKELNEYFGLSTNMNDSQKLSAEIIKWWNNKS